MSAFTMGLNTYTVPFSLHATNRAKVSAAVAAALKGTSCVVLLQGGEETSRFDTDHENLFRQESYFHYLFGVREPGFWGLLDIAADGSHKATLFCPRLPEAYAVWMGRIAPAEEFAAKYEVESCLYVDTLDATVRALCSAADGKGSAKPLLLHTGVNSDSGSTYPLPTLPDGLKDAVTVDTATLFPLLAESRVVKSPAELQLMAHVSKLSSLAHVHTMRSTKPGMREYQLESLFNHFAYYNYGCRVAGYTAICACGPNPAVLHYGHAGAPNDRGVEDGDLCLLDMGAEYHCYGSDITCSFPANGTFTARQRIVYEGVLRAQVAVYDMLRPGVSWLDCHLAAEAEVVKALILLGCVVLPAGSTLQDAARDRLGAVFFPHGLGHLIGIDTHDVGGYLPGMPERSKEAGTMKLRTARVVEEGMCLTVEPGCYFIDALLDKALASDVLKKYLVESKIAEMRGSGGVRLEDVVAITGAGCVNFTMCPRTVEEVEGVMKGEKWPPVKDEAPELRREGLLRM